MLNIFFVSAFVGIGDISFAETEIKVRFRKSSAEQFVEAKKIFNELGD